jgi:PhzF family phenazine biosynthesis protein
MSFIALVDVFSDFPFKGSPSFVCLTKKPLDQETMISITKELNNSETAFLHALGDENYSIVWFSPNSEILIAGNTTFAAAHILHAREGMNHFINFQSKSGELIASLLTKGGIEIQFPTISLKNDHNSSDLDILKIPYIDFSSSGEDLIVEVETDYLLNFIPDNFSLMKIEHKGLILTSKSNNSKYNFLSRYFARKVSITEDPVSSIIHLPLSSFWSKKLNQNHLIAYQASSRGGLLIIDFNEKYTKITGKCTTIFQGEMVI